MLFKGKNLYTLNEGRVINSLQGLLNDLEKLTYGSYLCELMDIAIVEGESNRMLFKEFVSALYLLDTEALDYELLTRSFELKLLKATGYGLELNNCSICKKSINSSNYISLSNYGGVCETCKREHGVYLSPGAYNALRFLSTTSLDKVYRLSLNKNIKDEIFKVLSFIICNNYSKKPKSLDMLSVLKESGKNE